MAWCKLKQIALLLSIIMFANSVQAFEIIKKDARQKEALYIHKVHKNEEKEKLGRKKENYKPSGFMTVEEYSERLEAVKAEHEGEEGALKAE